MRNILFGFFLTGTVLVFSLVLGAEFFLQSYLPESSILSQVQSSGYLSTFPLVVEPNKGIWHSIGWAGSTSMIVMLLYSVRKRFRVFHTFGNLYTWLNIHIFLGVVGPVLVTFHTTFKLGGLVSVSFWCMILVAASGFLGRYIFLKIPRGISGHALEMGQIESLIDQMEKKLQSFSINQEVLNEFIQNISPPKPNDERNPFKALFSLVKKDLKNLRKIRQFKAQLKKIPIIEKKEKKEVLALVKRKARLIRGMNFLSANQQLLNYWHIFHIPLTLILFFVMFLHIGIYFLFKA